MDYRAKVFVSYAHEDSTLCQELVKRLRFLERQGTLDPWHDVDIRSGTEWKEEIDKNLEAADLILALITADFLASNFCYEMEISEALKLHKRRRSILVPIIARPCAWAQSSIAGLQVVPAQGKPITAWTDQDQAWESVLAGVSDAAARAIEQRVRFADMFLPEMRRFIENREKLCTADEDSVVGRNLRRLSKAHPPLSSQLTKYQAELKALNNGYQTARDAAYDHTYSSVPDMLKPWLLVKHQLPVMSKYLALTATELTLLDSLARAQLDHQLFGLPTNRTKLEGERHSMSESYTKLNEWAKSQDGIFSDIVETIIKGVDDVTTGDDFEKP
jgi:hypothetical protein